MVLKELSVQAYWPFKQIDVEISQKASLLGEFFIASLNNYETYRTGKIVIRFTRSDINEVNGNRIRKNRADVLLDTVEFCVDFNWYQKIPKEDQMKYQWLTICDSVIRIAKQLDWDKEPLIPIFQKGIDSNFGLGFA